jgi:hypothetical protein
MVADRYRCKQRLYGYFYSQGFVNYIRRGEMKVFRSFKVEFTCPDDWAEQRIVEECDKFDAGEVSDKIEELMTFTRISSLMWR